MEQSMTMLAAMPDLDLAAMPDLDLADAKLDLTSWLFEDDHLNQQDFCNGAKEAHFLPSGECLGSASPPFITSSQGENSEMPDWMEAGYWNDPMTGVEECFSTDLKKHQLFEPLVYEPALPEIIFRQDNIKHQLKVEKPRAVAELIQQLYDSNDIVYKTKQAIKKEFDQPQEVILEETIDANEILFNQSYAIPSPSQEILFQECSYAPTPSYDNGGDVLYITGQDNLDCVEEVVSNQNTSPPIISVTVSDAFQDVKPIAKKEQISNIKFSDGSFPSIMKIKSSNPSEQTQKIVINLKRVSRPVKIVKTEVVPPTLKDIIENGAGDDIMRELMSPLKETADTSDASSDSIVLAAFDNSFDDNNSFLFSPMSMSQDNDSEIRVSPESPESMFVDEVSDDEYTSDKQSSRRAPYSLAERKLRKKEQNKRAADRYRQKKRVEDNVVLRSLKGVEQENQRLKEKYNALQVEVKIMRKLARDILISRAKK